MSVRWIEDNRPSSKMPLWTRANVGEVLPEPPTPLSWDLVWETGTLPGWRDCAVDRLGTREDELSVDRPEVAGIFGGYGYLNASATRLFGHRAPGMTAETIDAAYFGDHPGVPPFVPEDWHDDPEATATIEAWMGWVLTTTEQPDLEEDRRTAERIRRDRPELTAMSTAQLLGYVDGLVPHFRRMFDQHIHQSAAASVGPGIIAAVAEAIGDPSLTLKIIGAVGGVDSAAPSFEIWELSRSVRASDVLTAAFEAGHDGLFERIARSDNPSVRVFVDRLAEFNQRYGSRGPNEWEIHSHTWGTKPDLVLALVDRMRFAGDEDSPSARHIARETEREAIVEQVTAALGGDPEAHGQFVAGVTSAARFIPGRERSKTSIIKVVHEARLAVWELGNRIVATGGTDEGRYVCMLFRDELDRALEDPDWARSTIESRHDHYRRLQLVEPPFLFHGECPPPDTWPLRADASFQRLDVGASMQGVPGSSGSYRGRARIVLDPGDPIALEPGDVLVAPHTDPAWSPLFVTAGAVVVDVGAALSHAVIVSRELGLPCVVSATDATRMIPDGALIEVDGNTGLVTMLEC